MKLKRILYLGWLRHGNVGDDLLFTVFKELSVREALAQELGLIIDTANEEYEFGLENYDLVVLGGGSLLVIPYYLDICLKAKSLQVPVVIWGCGIDIRYKLYVDEVLYSFFSNFDYGNAGKTVNEFYKIKAVVEYAEIVSVRGNLTRYLLTNNKVKVIGDPGIIFDRLGFSYPQIHRVESFAGDSGNTVLVNWGTTGNNLIGVSENDLFENMRLAIHILLSKNYKIIIYPIWTQDISACMNLYNQFRSKNILLIDRVYDEYGISSMLNRSKFSINLKLHANILSMALQKPFVSLAYGLKCFDFAQSISAMGLIVPTDKASYQEILRRVDFIENNYEYIQNLFQKKIDEYYIRQSLLIKKVISYLCN